jgi:hypothetical protein
MRSDRTAAVFLAILALAAAAVSSAQEPAPPDTARAAVADTVRGGDLPDTTRAVAPADTTRRGAAAVDTLRGAPIDTTRVTRRVPAVPPPSEQISLDDERKRGSLSLAQSLRGLRPAWVRPLPMVGPEVGPISLPDAGSRIRTAPPGVRPVSATERPIVVAPGFGVGFLDLATSIDAPRAEEEEVFDLISLRADLRPASFARAGELLAQPPADFSFERVMPGAPARLRRPRSALYYGNGRSGELDLGVRFLSAALGWGIGGSHTRHEADGVEPLHRSRTERYALASGLPRALGHHLWVDGVVLDWTIDDEVAIDPGTGAVALQSRSELADRVIRLHGRSASSERWSSEWTVGAADIRRTQVDAFDRRERWRLPEASFGWNARAGSDSGWSARVEATARTRGIEYRVGESPDVDVRREEARLAVAFARAVGGGAGLEGGVAGDWRETDPTLLDARLSFWSERPRARFRIDAERAHERPTWIDLLTPSAVIDAGTGVTPNRIRITRSGDPTLGARSLTGVLARASYDVSPALSVTMEGAARRVEHDFGWTLTRTDDPVDTLFLDTLLVDTRAAVRGDGWASYAGASFRARAGAFTLHGAGWARGGPDRLSPRAGSPPRFGGDAAAETRVVLFQGDLPLVARVEAHGEGPRTGEAPEPGWIAFDGSFRADFGPAAVLVEYTNMFERVVPSGVTDLETGRAVPMPGRSLRLGIVWYLLD